MQTRLGAVPGHVDEDSNIITQLLKARAEDIPELHSWLKRTA